MSDPVLDQSLIDLQGETLKALGETTQRLNPDYVRVVEAARSQYATDDVEIDDNPMLSKSEDGYWVSAWVYVSNEEITDDSI